MPSSGDRGHKPSEAKKRRHISLRLALDSDHGENSSSVQDYRVIGGDLDSKCGEYSIRDNSNPRISNIRQIQSEGAVSS